MRDEIAQVIRRDQVMELVYGNNPCPKNILGRHFVSSGQVISAYHPDATKMEMIDEKGVRHRMDPVEQLPLFSVFIPRQKAFAYQIDMEFPDGNHFISEDPYSFPSMISRKEEALFTEGAWADCYQKLGAHPMTIHDVKGVYFAVWAPNARAVSVVGDFNDWSVGENQMNRLEPLGIWETFIPDLGVDELYKYVIVSPNGERHFKADPFANSGVDRYRSAGREQEFLLFRSGHQRNKPIG